MPTLSGMPLWCVCAYIERHAPYVTSCERCMSVFIHQGPLLRGDPGVHGPPAARRVMVGYVSGYVCAEAVGVTVLVVT